MAQLRRRLLIMGPPGAGKGTQAVGLAVRIGGAHVSTGDIFRANVRNRTTLGRMAQRFMDAGEYVPDSVTNAMVEERLAERDSFESFVLDGYPRTLGQVATLDEILARLGASVDGAIELVVDAEELIGRLLLRAKIGDRTDDTEDVIRRRQQVYAAETAPLLAEYDRRGLLLQVDGVGTEGEVTARIDGALRAFGPVAGTEDA